MLRNCMLFFLTLVFCWEGYGQAIPTKVEHVPKTISVQAQNFLRENAPVPYIPTGDQTWGELQRIFEKQVHPISRLAVREFCDDEVETKKFGGVDVVVATPKSFVKENKDKAILYVHGGGYVYVSAQATLHECLPLAHQMGMRVYSIDYPLAPQNPFPAGLNACVAAYRDIIKTIEPENICVSGVSAGGGMVVSMMLKAHEMGLPMPAAVASITPWADLTIQGDSYYINDGVDPLLYRAGLTPMAKAYAAAHRLDEPLISPVYANYPRDFPPTIIFTGTRDLFLSNCVRLHRRMKDQGVRVELSVWEGMWHAFQVQYDLPESQRAIQEQADFFRKHL